MEEIVGIANFGYIAGSPVVHLAPSAADEGMRPFDQQFG
jgi:hypothetical protein